MEAPEEITYGCKFQVGGNIYLRKTLPKNNKEYFREVPIIGIVPKGTTIEILEIPHGIDRKFAIQYWTKVKILE
jgi:hypothetical protein